MMTLKKTKLRDAIMFALVAGATGFAGTAMAQQAPPTPPTQTTQDSATTLDAIVVTGTRIQSQTVTASSPVTEIQQEEFQYAGATRTEDLVNQYPQMSPSFDSFVNNGSLGYPTVNLRGLGSGRTLTLVNGLRLAPGAFESADISIVPSFMVQRVDILTGGASAVYGSDAVGGVVNFILDTEFEGVKMSVGGSGYQHNNDNGYIQGLLKARNFEFPEGNNGLDGRSRNVDIAVGSSFADGRGHGMAWFTWRENDELFQGERDYSACALNGAGTACGGSSTNRAGSFFFYQPGSGAFIGSSLRPDGTFKRGFEAPFNYAPVNYYQRPDERYTFGSSVNYEINEHFKPYLEAMYITKRSATELAPSGSFFQTFDLECSDPLIRTGCADLGLNPANGPLVVYVGKRNLEAGPNVTNRFNDTDTSQFRVVAGVKGDLTGSWSYNTSFLYGQTDSTTVGINDFLTPRLIDAVLGCPSGSFSGCLPYRVFVPGGVTAEAAAQLVGTSLNTTNTETIQVTGYVTGETAFGSPWANGEKISVVAGLEWRKDTYGNTADSDSQAGNFAGAGGPSRPVNGVISVHELFTEAAIPVFRGEGFLRSFDLEAAYRMSDYNFAGRAETYKLGFNSNFGDLVRLRGGYNKAIRAPGVGALFSDQQIALFGGIDPCAGIIADGQTPVFTAAQCVNLGVPTSRYGQIAANPAGQYNQFVGGNLDLKPEEADTYTLGFVVTPLTNLRVAVDYYDIAIEDTISTVGAQTILDQCGLTGNPLLCAQIRRSPSGNLFAGNDPATAGLVRNLTGNFGEVHFRGIDLSAFYRWDMLGGGFSTSFQGNYLLEQEIAPLAPASDSATYDCAGKINVQCQSPEWRHIANLRYSREWGSVNLRWRYFGEMDYVDRLTGLPLSTDKLLCSKGSGTTAAFASCLGDQTLEAYNYFDLSATALVGSWGELTVGVNNIADKEPPLVGVTQALNGNAPGGYDQAGRFFFTSFTVKF